MFIDMCYATDIHGAHHCCWRVSISTLSAVTKKISRCSVIGAAEAFSDVGQKVEREIRIATIKDVVVAGQRAMALLKSWKRGAG